MLMFLPRLKFLQVSGFVIPFDGKLDYLFLYPPPPPEITPLPTEPPPEEKSYWIIFVSILGGVVFIALIFSDYLYLL